MGLYMKILPVKALYREIANQKQKIAAIICCEEPIQAEKLFGTFYIHVPFADVLAGGAGAFCRADAGKIAEFVNALPDDVERLYIACSAGESRSAAVGAAIIRYFGGDDLAAVWLKPKFHPNPYVYKIMLEAFGIKVSQREIRHIEKVNAKALKKAIRQTR